MLINTTSLLDSAPVVRQSLRENFPFLMEDDIETSQENTKTNGKMRHIKVKCDPEHKKAITDFIKNNLPNPPDGINMRIEIGPNVKIQSLFDVSHHLFPSRTPN